LPIKRVVARSLAEADTPLDAAEPEEGVAVNSKSADLELDGMPTKQAKEWITEGGLSPRGLGRKSVNYKLRDWLFSRQRYWGEPFPVLLDRDDRAHAVAASDLP